MGKVGIDRVANGYLALHIFNIQEELCLPGCLGCTTQKRIKYALGQGPFKKRSADFFFFFQGCLSDRMKWENEMFV